MAGNTRFNKLISSPIHSENGVNLTMTTSQQQGLIGTNWGPTCHISLDVKNGVNVILLVARGGVSKMDYSFNLSVLMVTCCRVAVISNLCPCCDKVLIYTVPAA